jgi:tetratricopeptide (TPR) repeat protein
VTDQNKGSRLAREGFDLWQAGKLDESVAKYQQAFLLADPDHYALADYHGEFAAVLATLGRDAAALEQYREAVAVSVRQDPDESGLGVAIARYFLAEHLLKVNKPEEALEAIVPALHSKQPWLAHVVYSDALWKLGRREESKTAAGLALELANSDKKRANVRERLAHILNWDEQPAR